MKGQRSPAVEKNIRSQQSSSGNLFILSAPSGAGKTTLCRAILTQFSTIQYSISHTTRSPRPGEKHGVDYFFTPEEDFLNGIQDGSWAEWARVHDHYYGTSIAFLDKTLAAGSDVLLDIDVQGAMQIIKKYPSAITVFIMPPSIETLQKRLQTRGTDSDKVIAKRLQNAREEIAQKDNYQHIVINDRLEDAKQELFQLIRQYQNG